MFCTQCGAQLTEDARFCTQCGAAVNRTEEPTAAEEPTIVEEPSVQAPEEVSPAPVEEPTPEPRKKPGKLLWIIAAAVVVLALLAVGIVLFASGGRDTSEMVAYVTDDYELMFLKNTREKTEAVELSDEANASAVLSAASDGKYLYFREYDEPDDYSYEGTTLMRMEIAEIGKEGAKAEKIDSDVAGFWGLDNGGLFYYKWDDDYNFDIYIHNGEQKTRLTKDAGGWDADDAREFLYYTEEDEDTCTLYRIPLSGEGTKETLLKGVSEIWSDWDAEILVYGEYDEEEGGYTVYTCTPGGGEKEKVLENVASVLGVNTEGGKVSFYYTTRNYREQTLYDMVTDTCADSDAAILKKGYPDYPDYPYQYEYEAYYLVDDGYRYIGYETGSGVEVLFENGFTTTDWDEAVDLAISMSEARWEAAQSEYNTAAAEYEKGVTAYDQAQQRQYLREDLKNWDYSTESYALYQYKDGESVKLADEVLFDSCASLPEEGIFLYQKVTGRSGKVADIEELEYSDEVYELLESQAGDEDPVWYVNVGGTESELDFDTRKVQSVSDLYLLEGKDVLIRVWDGETSVLESYTLAESGLTFAKAVSDDADYIWSGSFEGKEALYFMEEYDEERCEGDLICFADGQRREIVRNVCNAYFLKDGGVAYALGEREPLDDYSAVYELQVKQGDKWVAVADDCQKYIQILDSERVLYISDDDLYLWDGKENRRIARDVLSVWAVGAEYQLFEP